MAGYIGSRASVVSSGAERKKTFAITTTTTVLTGLSYTPTFVHLFHNGIRLVDGTDYTATNGTSITLVNAAENGDEVVVVSYATFSPADTYSIAEADAEFLNDPASVITVSGSNVGIGTSSPSANLEVSGSSGTIVKVFDTSASATGPIIRLGTEDTSRQAGESIGKVEFFSNDSSSPGAGVRCSIGAIAEDVYNRNALIFSTGDYNAAAAEALRIDSSGNLLVGTTDSNPVANNITSGVQFGDGRIRASRADRAVLELNRKTSDGTIAEFRKDGTTVGSIGTASSSVLRVMDISGGLAIGSNDTGIILSSNESVRPYNPATNVSRDNAIGFGESYARWVDIWAVDGSINTSDGNEKQQIAALTDAEMTAAKAISQLFKTYKWNSAVSKKGDAARTHSGVIAQEVEQAMTDAGLDAGDYAFFISSTWWETQTEVPAVEAVAEVLDEDGNAITAAVEAKEAYTRTDTYDTLEEAPEGATEHSRMGIRYHELLSFVGAATEQRLTSIETRLAALEVTP